MVPYISLLSVRMISADPFPRRAIRSRTFVPLLLAAWFCGTTPFVRAQGNDLKIENIAVGFRQTTPARDVFKVADPTPLAFDIVGAAGTEIQPWLRVADPDGRAVEIPLGVPPALPASDRQRITTWFRSGRIQGPLQIQLRGAQGKVAQSVTINLTSTSTVQALPQSAQLWMTIGEHRLLAPGAARWNRDRVDSLHIIDGTDAADIQWNAQLLDSIDVVLARQFAQITAAQSEALRDWVAAGGRLVLSIGEESAALRSSPLANWLPSLPEGDTDVANLQSLNDAVASPNPLRFTRANRITAGRLTRTAGKPLVDSLTGALVLRSSFGAGTVTLLGISLDEDVLVNWDEKSQADLLGFLADVRTPWQLAQSRSAGAASSVSNPSDISEMLTQILFSVDHFPTLRQLSHWHVLGWIFLFAVIVGPVDYLFVRFVLKNPSATWVTLPIWTALACGLAMSQTGALTRLPAMSRQLELVDLDASRGTVRAMSWRTFSQPERRRSQFEAKPAQQFLENGQPQQLELSWFGRPESGFRGIYRSGGIDEAQPAYQLAVSRDALIDYPLPTHSTSTLFAQWTGTATERKWATSRLKMMADNRLTGSFEHHLPGELTDWMLAFSSFVYEPRGRSENGHALAAGSSFDVDQARSALLEGRLRGLRQVTDVESGKERGAFARDEYNPQSREPLDVARMLTFYTAAGGQAYTHLSNDALEKQDLTRVLDLNHAVLFGRLRVPATAITSPDRQDQNSETDVFVRVLLPVDRTP